MFSNALRTKVIDQLMEEQLIQYTYRPRIKLRFNLQAFGRKINLAEVFLAGSVAVDTGGINLEINTFLRIKDESNHR